MKKLLIRSLNTSVRLLKKLKNSIRVVRSIGLTGVINVARTKLAKSGIHDIRQEVDDLQGTDPIFRYATCNDLITLMAQYPQYCREDRNSKKSHAWGLKAMGTLFCVDKIVRFKPARMLEAGAGWNRHFDHHFGADLEYWMIDEASDIGWDMKSLEKFEQSVSNRQNTHFVRGLLGSFLPELPDDSFDLVFSISVIEHISAKQKSRFYEDMFRILKPGGVIAHSIDIVDEHLGRAEFEAIFRAGFQLPKQPDLKIRVRPSEGNPTLFEDFWTVFHGYLGLNRPDKWVNLKKVQGHYPTILVFARKPLA